MLFPEGISYSIKKREYRTAKTNKLFELTNSFNEYYIDKKQKTHHLKSDEFLSVHNSGKISNQLLIDYYNFSSFYKSLFC